MHDIADDQGLQLQILVTGMHLSPEFGLTYQQIEADGFLVDRKVEMLTSSDTPEGITKSMGLGMIGFADALSELNPDLLLVLGDRFEIFAVVASALIARIPVAHLHGGESTEGLVDEAIRHSITKMSHLHFVAAEPYRKRVIQLGEQPEKVFMVGGLGVDNIKRTELMEKRELEESLGFTFFKNNLLITFHPVTLEKATSEHQTSELLAALEGLNDTNFIFTLPNADTDGRIIADMINEFINSQKKGKLFPSLGQVRYFSCLAQIDGVIGNSSSGLTEVPSFNIGTINIGDRQRGRLQANSIINCEPNAADIAASIQKLYSKNYQKKLINNENPYGSGGASHDILSTIKNVNLTKILKKEFFEVKNKCG
jgi:GDP/UDP-N,N'-diacetylbacillosamine 2-epimerase (hydrolysing)